MRVLVIGGAGYIGSHIVKELAESGHEPWVFDNFSTGRRENVLYADRCIEGCVFDETCLRGAMGRGWDAVIHLAALKAAGESMVAPEKYSRSNLVGSVAILNAMAAAGVPRLVFSSTAAVYGEPRYLPVDEAHPTEPANYYGFTKLQVEEMLAWYQRLRGISFAALRYFNAAGYAADGSLTGIERNPLNLLPIILEVACGLRPELLIYGDDYATPDGSGIRDYVHVSDLARAHVRALRHLASGAERLTVNLGSESGISVFEMLASARRISGKTIPARVVPRRRGDPARVVATSALARQVLGWEARESGVDSLVSTAWAVYQKSFHV